MKIYPGAKWRPLWFSDATPTLVNPRGWILHVPVGNGSLFSYFNGLKVGYRKASTGWVSKKGLVEQYLPADKEPWAQVGGNGFGTAWEVEGYPSEPMTDAQLQALARIHIWLGSPDTITDSVSGHGIGTHSMGGAAWGGHECPGAIRAKQRQAILNYVKLFRNPTPTPIIGDDMLYVCATADSTDGTIKKGCCYQVSMGARSYITNPKFWHTPLNILDLTGDEILSQWPKIA